MTSPVENEFLSNALLDKGVVRRVYEYRYRISLGLSPTASQTESAEAFDHLIQRAIRLYITQQTTNILRLRNPLVAARILSRTDTLQKGKYLRRWARRLRRLAFTREDAIVIAYGSFGVDKALQQTGTQAFVTTDLKLVSNFEANRTKIEFRFSRMTKNLSVPYSNLKLPTVMTTAQALVRV